MMKLLATLMLLLCVHQANAVIETFEFDDDNMRQRYHDLIFELRCPKCQNQNLADSDAPIAADLRNLVYRLLNEGKNDDQIKLYLVERYGDFVLYNPPVNSYTIALWLVPAGGLLLGAIVVLQLVRRTNNKKTDKPALDSNEQQRVADILSSELASESTSEDKA